MTCKCASTDGSLAADNSLALAGAKNHRFLSYDRWFLHTSLVRRSIRPTQNVALTVEQGGKNLHCVDCGSGHSLAATKEDPAMFDASTINFLFVIY
jgi:hypothetical protein